MCTLHNDKKFKLINSVSVFVCFQWMMTDVMLVDAAHNTAAAEHNITQNFRAHCTLLAPLARLAGLQLACLMFLKSWNIEIIYLSTVLSENDVTSSVSTSSTARALLEHLLEQNLKTFAGSDDKIE